MKYPIPENKTFSFDTPADWLVSELPINEQPLDDWLSDTENKAWEHL